MKPTQTPNLRELEPLKGPFVKPKISDEDLLNKAEASLKAGVDGLIFGRNMWQRKFEDALEITKEIKKMMQKF